MSGNILDALAHPATINLLADYKDASQTANNIWQNRDWQAKQAAGEAQQGGIDANGQYQPAQALNLLKAAGPGAALAVPTTLTNNQNLSTAQTTQAADVTKTIAAAFAPLINGPDDSAQMHALVGQTAERLVTAGVPRDIVNGVISRLPPDSAGIKQQLELARQAILGPQQQQASIYGTPGSVTAPNGSQVGTIQNPQTGAISVPPQPGAPQGTSPETRAGLVTVSDAAGNKYVVPRSSLPGASGSDGGAAPPTVGPGRIPASLRNPNAPQPGAAPGPPTPAPAAAAAVPPAATGVPSGATLSSISPATETENQGAAQHAVAARDQANSYQQRIQPIEGAITALAGADTGKGGEVLNTLRAYTQDVAPTMLQKMLPASLNDKDARVAYEEANKYLTGMAINAPGGARSNAGQEAAGAATPSVHISNQAAQLVARAVLAQQRLTQAGTLAFNQSGQPAQNYDRFMNTWNTNADPRAFVADKMSPEERGALVKSMGGVGSAAYQRFKQSYQDATANGVVPLHAGQ
jgi:hypothetical protein